MLTRFKQAIITKIIVNRGNKMLDKLEGKKTYIVLGVAAILGALDAYNAQCVAGALCKAVEIPPVVYSILAGLGIYTRSLAKK